MGGGEVRQHEGPLWRRMFWIFTVSMSISWPWYHTSFPRCYYWRKLSVRDWIASLKVHVEALNPRWLYLEIGPWKKVIKVKWIQQGRALNQPGVLRKRGRDTSNEPVQTKGLVRTQKASPCMPRRGLQEKPHLLTPLSWTSSLQKYEITHFCCLSPSGWWCFSRAT